VRRAFALAVALALVPVLATAAPIVVRLVPEVVVHTDEVTLADVADIQGGGALADRLRSVRLMIAPPAGATQPLFADTIRARMHTVLGDVPQLQLEGSARVLVTRGFQIVRGGDLIEAVRRDLRARLEAAEAKGEPSALMPINRPEDVRVATGEVRLETRLHEGAAGAPTLAATVTVRVNGRERHQVILTFQLARLVNVIVVARPLEMRRTLAAADFRQERRPAAEVPPDALTELVDAADLELVHAAQPGEGLTPRVVRPRLAVKRGELVTLLLEGDGFQITTQAQASEDGRRGDTVRVVNVSSKREVVGSVEGAGVVRVPYRKLGGER
jgi:flagella basal body P-ring formation protein FlgA